MAIGGLGAATVRTSELTATLTNLERLTRYQIGVRATNAEGQGKSSSAVYGTTGLGGRCVTPTLPGRSALSQATLIAKEYSRTYSGISKEVYGYGFLDSVGALSPRTFTSSSTDYEIKGAFLFDGFAAGQFAFLGYAADTLVLTLDRPLSENDKDELRLHVCGTTFNFSDSIRRDYGPTEVDYVWQSSGLDWSAVAPRFLYISRSAGTSQRSPTQETKSEQSTPENSLIASFSGVPREHDGATKFSVRFHLSEESAGLSFRTVHNGLFDVTGGEIVKAKRLTRGQNNGWHIDIMPDGLADVTLQVRETTACNVAPGVCTADGRMLTERLLADIPGPAKLSISDATVEEGPNATLEFTVTMSRSRFGRTTVDYATSDGTALAGSDYTETNGTLTFNFNETSKTISVPVLDDSHDEGSETLTLALSNHSPNDVVIITDATGLGTINNTDLIPSAWISRFGRTVASQVFDAIDNRLSSKPEPGAELSLAGNRFNLDGSSNDEAFANMLSREDITVNDVLAGTSFMYTENNKHSDRSVSMWARGAFSSFSGQEDDLSVDGDVLSGMIGADWSRNSALMGISVGRSNGDGAYDAPSGDGEIEADITGIYPYWRHELNKRMSVWGVMGYGSGKLTVTPEDQNSIETDTDLILGVIGLRGIAKEARDGEGLQLAVTSDAMMVRTSSDATQEIESAETDVSRVRVGLESTWHGFPITPSLAIGARHDGGDAETGFGIDIGGGLSFTVPDSGLTFDLTAQTLINHESDGFKNNNIAASLSFDPKPVFNGRFTGAPVIGLAMSEDSQDWRFGYRMDLVRNRHGALSIGFDTTGIGGDDPAVMARVGVSW